MKSWILLIVCIWLSACSTTRSEKLVAGDLLRDDLFAAASVSVRAEDAIEMTDAMRDFARNKIHQSLGHVNNKDIRTALVEALYTKGQLRLEYASDVTRTAGEAFDSNSGNCLSLVLLTAAMARELRIPYHYQSVLNATDWSQSDKFFMSIGHVNIVLERVPDLYELKIWSAQPVIVDFLTPDKAASLDTQTIDESTILAMFSNNRAVESLLQGNVDNAYWWVRASIEQDSQFLNAFITLGVIYRAVHHPELAEQVLAQLSKRYPDNASVITNHILVLMDLGRESEALELRKYLAVLDQRRPWSYYFDAQGEFNAGHYTSAKGLYERELARNPDHHEIEYGLAQTYIKLNDMPSAIAHLQRAIDLCLTRQPREVYVAELHRLTTIQGQ